MDSFYVSHDDAATWSVLPLPGGITFTSALSCGSAAGCAAGALYNGQPVFITTADGGHSWTVDPLPAGDGRIFKLSCPSATTCQGLASAQGKTIAPGFSGLLASVRVVGTTDGGRHFTAVRFKSGHSLQDISCPTTTYCVAVGVYDESVRSRSALVNGFVMFSRDGGATWRWGSLPAGLSPGPFPQVSCLSSARCWMIGYVHDVAYSVMASSADGGATWTEHHLPAAIPDPQLYSFACPTAVTCYAAGEDSVPQQIGNTYNEASAVVAVTQDARPDLAPGQLPGARPCAGRHAGRLLHVRRRDPVPAGGHLRRARRVRSGVHVHAGVYQQPVATELRESPGPVRDQDLDSPERSRGDSRRLELESFLLRDYLSRDFS